VTLIIALKCKDGVVIASDGQATALSSGGPVRQKIQKIFKLGSNVVFGASGSVGTVQRCRDLIKNFAESLSKGLDIKTREELRQNLFQIMKNEVERHKAFHGNTKGAPLADILICTHEGDKGYRIWHIAPDCADELLDELGYACTGIGDTFAYTLLRNYYSSDVDIEKGKLVAYRVIKDAIDIGAYGLGEPVDIWTMKMDNGDFKIEQLSNNEIMALNDAYVTWKEAEKSVFKNLARTSST
jgi:20S proteasome alpha/beta subunit